MDPFGAFGGLMTLFIVAFFVIFALVLSTFVWVAVKAARTSAANRAAPEVTASAAVVDKRIETSGGGEMSVTQRHFVTFEQPSGERFELEVPATEYGMLVEGDRGNVAMKGTQYLGFTRELLR